MNRPIKIDVSLINQAEIARRLNVSPAYINMLLKGKRKSEKYEQRIKQVIQSLNAA